MGKIIDCFLLGLEAELDVLEIRLNELKDVVDYHVISEANLTHSNRDKPCHFIENINRFEPFLHKIIYNPSDLSDLPGDWQRENKQRNDIMTGIHQLELDGEDTILISDLDEIPRAEVIATLVQTEQNFPISFNHAFYAYYLNLMGHNNWVGTVALKRSWLTERSPQYFRNHKDSFARITGNNGWHFSYVGGAERVLTKLRSFAHQENPFKDYSLESFEEIFKDRVLKDKQFCFDNDSVPLERVEIDESYPVYIQQNLSQFSHLIINE